MAAFCMLSYGMVGYLWWITHNELRFMVYWLMSIRQHGPVCLDVRLPIKKSKNRSKPTTFFNKKNCRQTRLSRVRLQFICLDFYII